MNRPSLIYASAEMALDAEDVRKNRTEGAPALVTAGKPSAERLRRASGSQAQSASIARLTLVGSHSFSTARRIRRGP